MRKPRITAAAGIICACLSLFINARIPASESTVVRAGFTYDGDYMYKDAHGRYCGYEVEYLYNAAQLAGWTIKFVDINDLSALDNGSVDILCGLVRTPEREKKYLFSDKRMGATYCTLMVRADDMRYIYGDTQAFKGMRTGIEKYSFLAEAYPSWCKKNGLQAHMGYFDQLDDEIKALKAGSIDAVAVGGEYTIEGTRKVAEFQPVDFYMAFLDDGKHAAMKSQLDTAMARLLLQNPLFELQLHNKYFGSTGKDGPYFSKDERTFIRKSPTLRVAVLADDQPYSFLNRNGIIDGIIPDYFKRLSSVSGLLFSFVPFDSLDDIYAGIHSGKADIIGLYCSDIITAGSQSLNLTESYSLMNVVQITRKGTGEIHRAAIDIREDELLHDKIAKDSGIELIPYSSSRKGFAALKHGKADALITDIPAATWLMNHGRASDYTITPLQSYDWEAACAIEPGRSILLGILNKSISALGNDISSIITKNTIQYSTGLVGAVQKIPIAWAVSVIAILFIMFVLLAAAVLIIIRKHKIETALAIKQAQAEQRETQLAAMQKANEEKDRFFSTISHDMRTPLNGILGFTTLAKESTDMDQIHDYLSKIMISGSLLLDLVNDTLTISRVTNGKLTLHMEPIDNYELMDYIAVPIRQDAERTGIHFTIDTSKARKRKIITDRLNMQKIFLNLLSNALKFTPKGGHVVFSIQTMPFESHDADTIITVKDDGIGMSPSFMPRMFEPFSQERRDPKDTRGSGLGLSIVKQLVALFGGTINVTSQVDKGTCFTVKLHFKEAPDEAVSQLPSETYVYSDAVLKGKKVLLCEDNEMNAEIATALLKEKGMLITCADNGKDGFQLFADSAAGEYSAILMDLRMPVMDGYEAASAIRALKREDAASVPIIAMSADTFEDDIAMCSQAGMNGHIAKPVNPDALYAKLSEFIIA